MGCSGSKEQLENAQKKEYSKNGIKLQTLSGNPKDKNQIKKAGDIKILRNTLVVENTGPIIESYDLISKIGTGTFGKVYKVRHKKTKQFRAMKVVKLDTINYQDDEHAFLKEIEMLSQLDHPNIIKIYEYFKDDLNYYVITEFGHGGELYEKIYSIKNYCEADAAVIMKQLLSVVFYIHSKNIVHRDLKPENILLETNKLGDLSIKIIDFGTSNYYNKGDKLTLGVGTPYYIAPEVLEKDYSNKCDVWSCGVIMYMLLSGSPPFDGPDDAAILNKVKRGKFTFNNEVWTSISSEAKNLITEMLQFKQDERISAEEALKHAWFNKCGKKLRESVPTLEQIETFKKPFENLRNFTAKQKLQQATIAFLVHHVSSSEMIQDLRNIFKELDENGDGTLSFDEIKQGFKNYYKDEKIAEKELEEIMKNIDQDNNACIEYEEFIRATVNMDILLTDGNLKLAFAAFDKDNSGVLNQEEIKNILGVAGEENEIIKQIISEIDINGDGDISFEEFKKLMVKVLTDSQQKNPKR
jgi:calcium-dependent protein kinase